MKRLAVFLLLLLPWMAHTQQLIMACKGGDCLENGWDVINLDTFATDSFNCLDESLSTDGWATPMPTDHEPACRVSETIAFAVAGSNRTRPLTRSSPGALS
jgi:hypothetical protein